MISVFNFPCTFIFTYLLLYLLLNSCDGNDTKDDVFSSVDCWWLWKSRLCRVVPPKRDDFCVADAQSDVLSPSRMDVTAFCIDQQLRQWRFVMCLPMCQWCAVQVAGAASFPSQLFTRAQLVLRWPTGTWRGTFCKTPIMHDTWRATFCKTPLSGGIRTSV